MPTARFQPSFGAGVVSPDLYGRIDTQKYDVGLKVGFNCFVHVHGGVSNRAGTQYVGEVMDSTKKHRLIPMKRSETVNYVLVFGDGLMRVVKDGAYVMSGGSPYEIASPFNTAQSLAVDFTQSVDVIYMAQQEVYPQKLSHLGETNWTFANIDVDPSVASPVITSVVAGAAGGQRYDYKVSAVVDGVESFPSAAGTVTNAQGLGNSGAKNTISFTGPAGAEFRVYREKNGVYGYIGYTDELTFVDDNISQDLTNTPIESSKRFLTSDDYPGVVKIHQQRVIYGNTVNEPETVFPSRIGDYENFTKSRVLRADDSFKKSVTSDGIAEVKSMLTLRELLIFASSGEFSLSGPDNTLTATNPIETQYGYSGSSNVRPLVVEDTALFVDRTGRQVRDLRYAFEQDGYSGNDLTVYVPHYFRHSRIAGWAFAKNPFSIVWAYTTDGKLLSLTYKREHQVWAWCDHDLSGGEVEDAVVIPEGDADRLYMIVKRTINGQDKRYIERMDDRNFLDVSDAWFVDCGVKYEGAPTNVITGLGHLEGETVDVLADGNVISGLVVNGAQLVLPTDVSKAIVGLPYYSEIENLPPAVDLQDVGSARGRPISINQLKIQVDRTRGIKAGHKRDLLNEFIQTKIDLARPIGLHTGMVSIQLYPDWNLDGTIVIRQDYPLPMTILGIAPDLSIGRSD